MPTNFPGGLDTAAQLPTSVADNTPQVTVHAAYHDTLAGAMVAVENKLGSGASIPTNVGDVLTATGAGTSAFRPAVGPAWVLYGGTPASTGAASANVTAFSTAIAALPAAGGTIYVKAGVYWVNAPLLVNRSKVRVLGEPGSAFKLIAAGNTSIMKVSGSGTLTDIIIDTIEFDGNGASQTLAGGGGEAYGIYVDQVYRISVENCYIHDIYYSGVDLLHCGSVFFTKNVVDNTGIYKTTAGAGVAPANGLYCLGAPTDTNYPGVGFVCSSNVFRRILDIGIGFSGNSDFGCTIIGNVCTQIVPGRTTGGPSVGISIETETGDTGPSGYVTITGNLCDALDIGISIAQSGTTAGHLPVTINSNFIDNCTTGIELGTPNMTVVGNTITGCTAGLDINGQTFAFVGLTDWLIANNNISLTPGLPTTFGICGILLRAQAANPVMAVSNVTISNNVMVGSGKDVNGLGVNAGIYIEARYTSGTTYATFDHVHIVGNVARAFNDGVSITSDNVTATIAGVEIRGLRAYGCNNGVTFVAGGSITGVVIEDCDLGGNTSSAINGQSSAITTSIRHVAGFNDTPVAGPAIAIGASPYSVPTTYRDQVVNLSGGTVSAVTIGGVATGQTTGPFWRPAGVAMVVTHTGAPTATAVSY